MREGSGSVRGRGESGTYLSNSSTESSIAFCLVFFEATNWGDGGRRGKINVRERQLGQIDGIGRERRAQRKMERGKGRGGKQAREGGDSRV